VLPARSRRCESLRNGGSDFLRGPSIRSTDRGLLRKSRAHAHERHNRAGPPEERCCNESIALSGPLAREGAAGFAGRVAGARGAPRQECKGSGSGRGRLLKYAAQLGDFGLPRPSHDRLVHSTSIGSTLGPDSRDKPNDVTAIIGNTLIAAGPNAHRLPLPINVLQFTFLSGDGGGCARGRGGEEDSIKKQLIVASDS
jgi:hypothetical protein